MRARERAKCQEQGRNYRPDHEAVDAAGSLGTLIGADLLNFDKLADPKAPILSIGGAGTFDGIFVTGIVAVLIASVTSRHHGTARAA